MSNTPTPPKRMRKKARYFCDPCGHVTFRWRGDSGFGTFSFLNPIKSDRVECDNEYMTKKFIKARLCQMVDECKLRS